MKIYIDLTGIAVSLQDQFNGNLKEIEDMLESSLLTFTNLRLHDVEMVRTEIKEIKNETTRD